MSNQLKYFHIDWLTENDGPGKRVALFLQGCPLNCVWCHSPHSQMYESPILFFQSLCNNCKRCANVCPNQVHSFEGKKHNISRELCLRCGKCVEACPRSSIYSKANALLLPTKTVDVDQLYRELKPHLELLKDEGGITFSGGEPLLQYSALVKLAKKCKEDGINTALETSGIVTINNIYVLAPYIDTWLFGMRLTTGNNSVSAPFLLEQTREFLQVINGFHHSKIIIRIPAIPSYTDKAKYLNDVNRLLRNISYEKVEVLPFNSSIAHYYNAMGSTCKFSPPKHQADLAFDHISAHFKTLKPNNHEKRINQPNT